MKQKKKISFLLGAVLIVSVLIGFGGIPAISNAVTSVSGQADTAALNTQLIQMLMEMIKQLQAQLQQLIAAKTNTTIQCGWCGNSCINWAGKDRSSIACNDVMPPAGSYCQNINGVCQITNTLVPPTTPSACTDSDGGMNIYQKGTATNGIISRTDECTQRIWNGLSYQYSVVNSCNPPDVCYSDEATCLPDGTVGKGGSGQSDHQCPNGCSNGACLPIAPTSTLKPPCGNYGDVDLDSYVTFADTDIIAKYAAGSLKPTAEQRLRADVNGDGAVDMSDSLLMARYVSKLDTTFPVCTPKPTLKPPTALPVANCYDSDGGQNFDVKGLVTGTWCTANGACTGPVSYDTCLSSSVLQEQYCDTSNNRQSVTYTCPNGCSNGACLPITTEKSGCCALYAGGCLDLIGHDVTLEECRATVQGLTQERKNAIAYEVCSNIRTSDSQKISLGWSLAGSTIFSEFSAQCETTLTSACTDSDGGTNYNVKGTTTGMAGNNVMTTDTDYCSGNNLVEWFCSGTYRTNTNYTCPNGCENGACKPVVPPSVPSPTITIATKPTTSGCSWCGNMCVLSSTLAGKTCANVMPPTNSTCTLVNGICTASNGGVVEGVETNIFNMNLGYGMENEDIKALQSILTAKGYFSGAITGYFGWQTEEAVKAFQLSNNLPATGIVGPLTRGLLNK